MWSFACYEGSLAQHLSQRYPPLPPLGAPERSRIVERHVLSDELLLSSLCTARACEADHSLTATRGVAPPPSAVHAGVAHHLRMEPHSGGQGRLQMKHAGVSSDDMSSTLSRCQLCSSE